MSSCRFRRRARSPFAVSFSRAQLSLGGSRSWRWWWRAWAWEAPPHPIRGRRRQPLNPLQVKHGLSWEIMKFWPWSTSPGPDQWLCFLLRSTDFWLVRKLAHNLVLYRHSVVLKFSWSWLLELCCWFGMISKEFGYLLKVGFDWPNGALILVVASSLAPLVWTQILYMIRDL